MIGRQAREMDRVPVTRREIKYRDGIMRCRSVVEFLNDHVNEQMEKIFGRSFARRFRRTARLRGRMVSSLLPEMIYDDRV